MQMERFVVQETFLELHSKATEADGSLHLVRVRLIFLL